MIAPALGGRRALLGLVALGAVAWLASPGPAESPRVSASAEEWSPPSLEEVAPAVALQVLGKSSLWGKLPEATAGVQREPGWRLVGIVRSGPEKFVLMKVDGQPEATLRVNDELPGGSRILRVDEDSLCILVNGARRRLPIHNTGPQVL